MEFNEKSNLVEYVMCPANISSDVRKKAIEIAVKTAEKFNMVGLLAVELFLTKQGDILINEVAPRPHNSGHHTIECCMTSQFDQHLRSILDLPLGETELIIPGIMVNLVGENMIEGDVIYQNINDIFDIPGVFVHIYGKKKSRLNRKMGHITIVNEDIDKAIEIGKKLRKNKSNFMKKVGIIMGSKSDLPVMQDAIDILNEFGIESEVNIVSAHRTPEKMFKYASDASDNGIKVIIAGAGGAAHLPGMVASITTLPVIGVPVKSRNSIDGWDSVLSILQMPNGVPVATVALNGAKMLEF